MDKIDRFFLKNARFVPASPACPAAPFLVSWERQKTKGGWSMERFAWKGRIKPGMQAEYKRRHDEIWPEMLALLKSAGIRNYSIWSDGRDVFGYYECEQGIAFAEKTQAGSPVVDRWNDYMQDVLDLEMDPETGAQPKLKQMFMME
jgi:L-rhamnose mutarotase